ncbi:MAG TPA: phosphotransferase, partial [Anaerolineales bacterium]|nr:phosphotransferase [Anaerolineales bacterium]
SSADMFSSYRISATAIYPFTSKEEGCLLRFCPTSEKIRENLLAELEFIAYLRNNHYPAVASVPSKTGEELVQRLTPWGEYFASVFKHVSGVQLSEIPLENDILFTFGSALGQLHKLSSQYANPANRRWTHAEVLAWIEETLTNISKEAAALQELVYLREKLSQLPINSENYGLVHYDFELDNVFFDQQSKSCSVIDFDDAMYHWYLMDIEQALDSLKGEVAESEFEQKKMHFLEGYKTHFAIDPKLFESRLLFRRFANLYGYTRILRAIQERWENEPDWLIQLRVKLNMALRNRSVHFGKTSAVQPSVPAS